VKARVPVVQVREAMHEARVDGMDEAAETEATLLLGLISREGLLGLPEDVEFLQSKRPHQVRSQSCSETPDQNEPA
jgi:hypothetical protein